MADFFRLLPCWCNAKNAHTHTKRIDPVIGRDEEIRRTLEGRVGQTRCVSRE